MGKKIYKIDTKTLPPGEEEDVVVVVEVGLAAKFGCCGITE
jgi:hypothetical protein